MNIKQAAYLANNLLYNNFPSSMFALGAVNLIIPVVSIANGRLLPGAICSLPTLAAVYIGLISAAAKYLNKADSEIINEAPDDFPLEHSEAIIIDDTSGLELLLQKTAEKKWKEWGTFLKSTPYKGKAVMHEVLDPKQAKLKGLIEKEGLMSLYLNIDEAAKEGYNGDHHYHPNFGLNLLGPGHYAVSHQDRYPTDRNRMNLLSFNTSEGPELIGYNKQFTYLPKDKTKRILVRATHEDILRYLTK